MDNKVKTLKQKAKKETQHNIKPLWERSPPQTPGVTHMKKTTRAEENKC